MSENKKELKLRVQDADPAHVGRNIITLDKASKQQLDIASGDIVEIKATKTTAAIVWPARPEDEGKGFVRMDSFIRHNAGAGLGDNVIIKKAALKEADQVVLAPTQRVRIIASGYNRILKRTFLGRPLCQGDSVWISVFGSGFIYRVVSTKPRGIVKITELTEFSLKEKPVKEIPEGVPTVAYEDIGGLREQVQKVREMVELPMRHPEIFTRLGIVPPKGVLLHGHPGTGKTLMAKAVANETNATFTNINAPEIMSKFVGEAEERLRQVFKEAEENSPSIIFIDEIDAIAPKRDEVIGEVERRVVAQMLALMDGLEARGNVIVMAATNRLNSLDEALRRPGRFDREIEFGIPDRLERKEILQIHTRGMPLAKDVDLGHFASITHGFVGADLESLSKEAAMKALRRYLPKIDLDADEIPAEILESLEVRKEDFLKALKDVQPSALREISVQIPRAQWKDVGGLTEVKSELKQVAEWPLKHPDLFKDMGVKAPKGILLYGPPGCGKTLLAKAVANESEANFISVKGPELLSMYVGESERAVRKIFRKARQVAPSIIFFDEIDAIAAERGQSRDSGVGNRVLNQLLTELDGLEIMENVVFLCATNRPDLVDQALLRPGRVDKIIEVPAPDEESREKILKIHTASVPLAPDVKIKELVSLTEGFSGADLEGLVREAVLIAVKENKMKKTKLAMGHFSKALSKMRPSISESTKTAYEEFKVKLSEFMPSYVR